VATASPVKAVAPAAARSFELRPRPPFELGLTVWALRRSEQNAIDSWDGDAYRRVLCVDGKPVELAVRQMGRATPPRLEVILSRRGRANSTADVARSALTMLLGLDVDLSDFYARTARDHTLGPLVERFRGVKPPRFPTLFECLLNAVACQQLSLAAGLTLLNKLAEIAGASGGTQHAFPAPADVLRLPRPTLRAIGFSKRKAETIRDLARAATAGELDFARLEQLGDSAIADTLTRQRGIGRWSADYLLLRGLGRLNVFPHHDVGALNGLRRFLAAAHADDDPQDALARWAPYAGMLYFHLLLRGLEERGILDKAESR
jgi:DNA-3-methyladenine glycosylase II